MKFVDPHPVAFDINLISNQHFTASRVGVLRDVLRPVSYVVEALFPWVRRVIYENNAMRCTKDEKTGITRRVLENLH